MLDREIVVGIAMILSYFVKEYLKLTLEMYSWLMLAIIFIIYKG